MDEEYNEAWGKVTGSPITQRLLFIALWHNILLFHYAFQNLMVPCSSRLTSGVIMFCVIVPYRPHGVGGWAQVFQGADEPGEQSLVTWRERQRASLQGAESWEGEGMC